MNRQLKTITLDNELGMFVAEQLCCGHFIDNTARKWQTPGNDFQLRQS